MTGLLLLAAMLAILIRAIARDTRAAWREQETCARVGRDQVRGVVERLSVADVQQRAAERAR